ncbi:MAG: TrkA family potassium uptake protein [Planctomycetes bacterium]|nr:TrkA family potassium uptake protein [Planctomycetota bacterium]
MRSVAVIGLGRFGSALALALEEAGVEVLALDTNEEHVKNHEGKVTEVVRLDARDGRELEKAGVGQVDVVVVAIGEDFEAAQETVLALRRMEAKHIIGRAQTEDRRRILRRIGAHHVVSPEEESAKRVAQSLTHPLVAESVDLGDGVEVATLATPASFLDRSLAEIKPNSEFGVLVVRVIREDGTVIMPPSATLRIDRGDRVTIIGRSEGIRRFASS